MKIATFNINGIKARGPRLLEWLEETRPAVACLQEIKTQDEGFPAADFEAIMTSPAVTVEPGTSVDEALALMTRRRFRHFPVVEDGTLVAFISIGDLVKHKMDEVQGEAEALRNYITAA